MLEGWGPTSWKSRVALQQPCYDNPEHLAYCLDRIRAFPALVHSGEILNLKKQIAEAGKGNGFLLHGGDCAERFVDCNPESIAEKLKIILDMSQVLARALKQPVVRIGRIAGQYAKPRSDDYEVVGSSRLPSYRGDIINGFAFDPDARRPDPERLVRAYVCSCFTLNQLRAILEGEFPHTELRPQFFVSHEALLLDYESALTQFVPWENQWFNLGAHFLWLGDRTRQIDLAHAEYLRGIANPIGVKLGPTSTADETVALLKFLNPTNDAGRITLISRMGKSLVQDKLPHLIDAVNKAQLFVTWSCDPMHGNSIRTQNGIKTREISSILEELESTHSVHKNMGSYLGGVHLELTGDHVTECIGGQGKLSEEHLTRNYQTYCDPRLNYEQSMEVAQRIAENFGREKSF